MASFGKMLERRHQLLKLPYPHLKQFDLLKGERIYLHREGGYLVPRAQWRKRGIFEVKTIVVNDRARLQTMITPHGLDVLSKSLGKVVDLFTRSAA